MEGKDRSALYLARSGRNFLEVQDGIAELEIATTASEKDTAKALINDGKLRFLSAMTKAASSSPENAATINALKGDGLDVLYNQCAAAISLGIAATSTEANLPAQ
jgi:hypothetical protein